MGTTGDLMFVMLRTKEKRKDNLYFLNWNVLSFTFLFLLSLRHLAGLFRHIFLCPIERIVLSLPPLLAAL